MASILKRGGAYRVRVIRKNFTPLTRTFKTLAEAKKWARNTETEIDQGSIKPQTTPSQQVAESLRFVEAAEHYLRTHTPLKRNQRSEAGIIRILINQWGERPVRAINTKEVAALRDRMSSCGKSGATIGHYLNAISVIYKMLSTEWGMSITNPTRGVRRPPQNPGRYARLSLEAKDLLATACESCSERLLAPIVQLALETGMRRGELLSLTWTDIDLEYRKISIQRTKNGWPRVIPISDKTVQILSYLTKSCDGRLFPIGAEAMRKHFERAVKRAEALWDQGSPNPFSKLRFHDLRHEALSQLSDKGLNVIELAAISGHRTVAMLARYTHPDTAVILKKINTKVKCA